MPRKKASEQKQVVGAEPWVPETLILEKLGPIKKLEIEPRPFTLLIGEQASGKSLVAEALYLFRGLEAHIARIYSLEWSESGDWRVPAVNSILNGSRP